MKSILVIEDDADIAFSLKYNLEKTGEYAVQTVRDGESGLKIATDHPPALVLLDLNLPGMDGIEVCRELRRNPATAGVPVIMLTARISESDQISGLDLGADDYVTKPFSIKGLLARVRAVLRRTEREPVAEDVLTLGPFRVDLEGRKVRIDGDPLELTRKEFDLLVALMRNRGRVLSRDRLLAQVWEYEYPGETRTVDVHIRRLRQKLGEVAKDWIETVVGVGYRFRGDT